MFTLDLPFPPSVNNLYVNRRLGGRHPSTKYKEWKTEAGWEVARRHPVPIAGRVKLTYVLADKGRCDLGNLEKATTDLLVTHKLIDGDGREIVRAINLAWSSEVKGVRVTVSRHIDCGASAPHDPLPSSAPVHGARISSSGPEHRGSDVERNAPLGTPCPGGADCREPAE